MLSLFFRGVRECWGLFEGCSRYSCDLRSTLLNFFMIYIIIPKHYKRTKWDKLTFVHKSRRSLAKIFLQTLHQFFFICLFGHLLIQKLVHPVWQIFAHNILQCYQCCVIVMLDLFLFWRMRLEYRCVSVRDFIFFLLRGRRHARLTTGKHRPQLTLLLFSLFFPKRIRIKFGITTSSNEIGSHFFCEDFPAKFQVLISFHPS